MRAGGARSRFGEHGLLGALVLIVGVFSVLPLARILIEAFASPAGFSLRSWARVLASPTTWIATQHSLETAFGGTLLAVIIGAAMALVVALTDIRGRNALVFCFVLPVMIAPQVTALAWLQLFGPSSPILAAIGLAPPLGAKNPLYSRGGIILLLGVQYAPLVFLTLRAGLRALPRELIEAARAAGAGRWTILRTIVLPLMQPALIAGVALCFVSCLGNFGIPAFLGIPANYLTLPTLIYQRLSGLGPSVLSDVSVLSLLIGAVAMIGILAQNAMTGRRDARIVTTSSAAQPMELGPWRAPVEIGLWILALAVLVLPFLALLMTSLTPALGVPLNANTATSANYAFVLFEHEGSRRAFRNSFALSFTAALVIVAIAVPLAYFIVWRGSKLLRALNAIVELPYALPGVVLSIAAVLLFLRPIPLVGFSIYNTVWIILFAYLARFLVLGLRPVVSGYHQLDRAVEEAAQIAGARLPKRIITVILPLVAPAAAAGALLIFLTAFNELTVSALLWSSGAETLGVIVFAFEQGGDSGYAAAIATLTVLATIGLMASTLLFARRLPQGVLPWRD
ncbi:iron ABC transporter permease [Terrarubrum flagellatum]|uniref:ABC transporter permease n=1 Tax=Terrirubrum flagellatum TaxID=2895980 RepID=UPI0031453A93